MGDIVLVEGNNELNVQLVPIAAPPPALANVYGKVMDAETGKGIPGASISFEHLTYLYTAFTDSNGNYSIPNIEPQDYSLVCSKAGYSTVKQVITVTAGSNEVNIALSLPPPTGPIHCYLINVPAESPTVPGFTVIGWFFRFSNGQLTEIASIGVPINVDPSWGGIQDIELFVSNPNLGTAVYDAWYLPAYTYVPGATYVFNWAARTVTRQ